MMEEYELCCDVSVIYDAALLLGDQPVNVLGDTGKITTPVEIASVGGTQLMLSSMEGSNEAWISF